MSAHDATRGARMKRNRISLDRTFIGCYAPGWQPVLQPKSAIAPTGVAIFLASCGNIDMGQDPDVAMHGCEPAHFAVCTSIDAACAAARAYIARNDLGGGHWWGGDVFDCRGECIGNVSYNGRFHPHPGFDAYQAELKADGLPGIAREGTIEADDGNALIEAMPAP